MLGNIKLYSIPTIMICNPHVGRVSLSSYFKTSNPWITNVPVLDEGIVIGASCWRVKAMDTVESPVKATSLTFSDGVLPRFGEIL
jgi:hypothetical protein